MLMGRALLAVAVGVVVLFTLIHVIFALPLWLTPLFAAAGALHDGLTI